MNFIFFQEERRAKEAEEARLREIAEAEERKKAEERAARAAQIEKLFADAESANEQLAREKAVCNIITMQAKHREVIVII